MATRVFSKKRYGETADDQRPFRRIGWPCLDQPGGCICKCHAISDARMRGAPTRSRPDAWSKMHDDFMVDRFRAGDAPSLIARMLAEHFKIPRTEGAVKLRLQRKHGLSMREGWSSSSEISAMLGVKPSAVERWRKDGRLPGAEGFGRWPRYRDTDVEAFVKAEAGVAFDPRRVKDARLRSLAETSAIVNRRRQSA